MAKTQRVIQHKAQPTIIKRWPPKAHVRQRTSNEHAGKGGPGSTG